MKKGKKAAAKSAPKSSASALSNAVKDLDNELNKLSKERADLKKQIKQTTSTIEVDREQEKLLQQRIAALLEKEAKLNQKKKHLQARMDAASDRANKISKIKSEIADI